jgi:hypothetical protein
MAYRPHRTPAWIKIVLILAGVTAAYLALKG